MIKGQEPGNVIGPANPDHPEPADRTIRRFIMRMVFNFLDFTPLIAAITGISIHIIIATETVQDQLILGDTVRWWTDLLPNFSY
ncbi:MAG: hypothetical protein WC554_10280, partial [Clostridia bacterium]